MAKIYDPEIEVAKNTKKVRMRKRGQYAPELWDGVTLPPKSLILYNYLKTHPTFDEKGLRRSTGCGYWLARHAFQSLIKRGLIIKRTYWEVLPVPFGDEEINRGVFRKGKFALDQEKKLRIPKSIRQHQNVPTQINADNSDAKEYFDYMKYDEFGMKE